MSQNNRSVGRGGIGFAAAILLTTGAGALAQDLPAATASPATSAATQVRKACGTDYAKFCSGSNGGSILQAACLRQYWIDLTPRCRTALKPKPEATAPAPGAGDAPLP